MNDSYDDYRDLTNPKNFINRSPEEQKRAALYFLQAGAIEALHSRLAYMRAVNPAYVLDLNGADLPRACLWQVDLAGAKMRFSNFDWSNLEKANLRNADLTGASLLGVVLRRADLRGANLSGADLRGADLTDAQCDGAVLDGVLEGPIPPERLRENKSYREPAHLALKKKSDNGPRPQISSGDLSSHDALERRNYDSPVEQKGKAGESGEETDLQKQMAERREAKKKEQKKWYEQKRTKEKFIAKKNLDQQKQLERKRQDDLAFQRKKKEQEDFQARKRREEESRRR